MPRLGSSGLEHRKQQLLGRPRIGRALEDHQLARPEMSSHLLCRRDHIGNIRIFGLPKWRRDADYRHVALFQDGEIRCRFITAGTQQVLQVRALHIGDVRAPGVQGRDLVRVRVQSGHRKSCMTERDGQRQTHIPLANNGEPRAMPSNTICQFCFRHRAHLRTDE